MASQSAAARMQQQHFTSNGNGHLVEEVSTVDPFPVLSVEEIPVEAPRALKPINVNDQSAFPSLGGPSKAATGSLWGAPGSAAQRFKQSSVPVQAPLQPSQSPVQGFTERVDFPTSEIQVQALASSSFLDGLGRNRNSSREPEPKTLGEVMKLLMKRHAVKIEASTSRNVTTFIIKGISAPGKVLEDEVATAKRELISRLSKKISVKVLVPASIRGSIVGPKGKTLKAITDSTGASVQVPARDGDATVEAAVEGEEGPLIPVTISGDASAVAAARAQILAIVSERAAKSVVKLEKIPKKLWKLLAGAKNERIDALLARMGAQDSVTVQIPRSTESVDEVGDKKQSVITVTGEREAATAVAAAVEADAIELQRTLRSISVSVEKRQYRFLVGAFADDLLAKYDCSIDVPSIDDTVTPVTILGPERQLGPALTFTLEQASAAPTQQLNLNNAHGVEYDRLLYATQVTRYIQTKSLFRKLSEANDVSVHLPRAAAIAAGEPIIDVVGKTAAGVAGACADIKVIVRKLAPSVFAFVEVDSLVHRHLIVKCAAKIKAIETSGVDVVFPPEQQDRSDILLADRGSDNPAAALAQATALILALAKEVASIVSVTFDIPAALHTSIVGKNGTTLNAVIGEQKSVSVTFGNKARNSATDATENSVVVRGPSDEVTRVKAVIERIAEESRTAAITNSYVAEFEIDTSLAPHIVGKAGASVNKLRDDLGVQIDIVEIAASDASKAKKALLRSKVTIKGRKENVEEAKRRILSQGEKIADEVTLVIPLPASLDRGSLIGKQGMYLRRLETKYEVKINFPDRKKDDDSESKKNANEILIKGNKKGAEAAKKEFIDLMEYEKENGHTVIFTVTTKALPRILGKAGASIIAIKDETNVVVDVDQASDDAPTASITLRGTKTGVATAKSMILAIAAGVDDEAETMIKVPRLYHTMLIGVGGAAIRELIARCGGPTEPRASGNTVRFPRQGEEPADEVTIKGPKAVVEKIKKALLAEVATLVSRIVYGVVVPHSGHATVIGKGAATLQEIQLKHSVRILVPGWKEYESTGAVINADEIKDASEKDIIKVVGTKEAALAASVDIIAKGAVNAVLKATVSVPRRDHARIANGGRFFRSLPYGTRVGHGSAKPPSTKPIKAPKPPTPDEVPAARIDDDEQDFESEIIFQMVPIVNVGEEEVGDIDWIVESSKQEDLDKVVEMIQKQLVHTVAASHIGWLTVPRSLMPRIVGRGGSGLEKLRTAGVEVDVVGRKDSNQLMITGTPASIEEVHRMIIQISAPRQ